MFGEGGIEKLQEIAERKDIVFDLSYEKLTENIRYSPIKQPSFGEFSNRILGAAVACTVS